MEQFLCLCCRWEHNQISESEENYEVFGSNPNKAEEIIPLASISVLYDVMNDILVDVSLHSYRYNERESSLFTYPSSGNKESLTLRSIHFLLENGNIEYLVTNPMLEQLTAANFQIYTGCDEELKVSTENLKLT